MIATTDGALCQFWLESLCGSSQLLSMRPCGSKPKTISPLGWLSHLLYACSYAVHIQMSRIYIFLSLCLSLSLKFYLALYMVDSTSFPSFSQPP